MEYGQVIPTILELWLKRVFIEVKIVCFVIQSTWNVASYKRRYSYIQNISYTYKLIIMYSYTLSLVIVPIYCTNLFT